MATYVVRRVFQGIIVLFLATFATYSIIIHMPGGPASILADIKVRGIKPSETYIKQLEKTYGLDKPYPLSYFLWLFDPEDTYEYKW